MATEWERLQPFLMRVDKPGRYIGEEFNVQVKDWASTEFKVALAFPDLYEIGLSHLGLRILYELINSQPKMLAERVYAPWPDFQKLLLEKGCTLYSLENKKSLREFDLIGFSLQYELSYTNILTMLALGGIPLLSGERDENYPLVIGGGPCAFNPEPLAEFFDCFLIGEAEEVIIEVLDRINQWKGSRRKKADLFLELEKISGIYVPSHFDVSYHPNGSIAQILSKTGNLPVRAVVHHFDQAFYPQKWLVPFLEIVHDRVAYEIQRGCTKGCRFCQAGMIYRPVREKSPSRIMNELEYLIADTGYEELSLTSLSSADYSQIAGLLTNACQYFTPLGVNINLPSLRTDSFSVDLAKQFQNSRKGSLTFAPEAGTERLRRVINKGVTGDDLLIASEAAFKAGWQKLKLYFMIGLPTETEEDLAGIVALAGEVLKIGRRVHPRMNSLRITVSVSTFVPKAHTPFQWRGQISVAKTLEKQGYLKEKLRDRHLELSWQDPLLSRLEGVFARGDRRLSRVIIKAWQKGAQFDSWSEHFQDHLWQETFADCGIEPDFYTRPRSYEEVLPWSHLSSGLSMNFLKREDQKADLGEVAGDCRDHACAQCGVCQELKIAKKITGVSND